jgi:cytochrome c-type biogenesis protein CcmF
LVILGTLNVRSGLVSSVHSFAQSNIGWFFLGFLGFMILFSLYWIVVRYDQLRSKNQIDSFLSREAAFMLNNVLFLLIAAVTLFFTYLPVMSELVTGQRMTVGASFFEKFNGPLFAALLVLMGIAPLTMWYRTSIRWLRRMTFGPLVAATLAVVILFILDVRNWLALLGFWIVTFSLILTIFEFIRPGYKRVRNKGESPFKAVSGFITQNRRRYGGYIIHLGVLVMAFGIISTELYQQETQIRLTRGNSVPLGEFSMVFNGVERYPGPDDLEITEASVDVFKDGEFVRTLNPRTELYTRTQQPMTIPGVRSTFTEDFYVIMINWEGTSADAATFRIYVNPLINWVWAGAFIFLAGTLVAAWPDPAEDKIVAAERSRRRIAISGATGD